MEIVSLVKCCSYDMEVVEKSVDDLLQNLGGLSALVKSGERVLLKANLLNTSKIEECVTTHPSIVLAFAKKLVDFGCEVTIGDSSGGLFNKSHMNAVYRTSGMDKVATSSGAKLNSDFTFQAVDFENGVATKGFDVINAACSCDKIFNLAKLKTHSLTFYTGATKNLFGLIPGMQKVQVHAECPELKKFTNYLLDIEECFKDKIALNVIDGILGMEGAGPASGTPRRVDRLIASTSALAADYVGISLMDGDPMEFPLFYCAKKRSLSPTSIDEIEVVGENLRESIVKGYKLVLDDKSWKEGKKYSTKFGRKLLSPYPWVNKNECKGCQKCVEHCPNNAITMENKVAKFDLDKCIRCFCCQELCPFHLIKVKRSLLAKIVRKL